MIQFTIERRGPHQFVLNRATHSLTVSIQRRILQFTLHRSTVVIAGRDTPLPGPVTPQWNTLNW